MRDQYLTRRDVLDRVFQNPNAAPIVYPDTFGAILRESDVAAIVRDAAARLGLSPLAEGTLARLSALDTAALIDEVKADRDLIGFVNKRSYDNASAESRAAWEVLWDGMRAWDNRSWDWQEIAAGTALAALFCPLVEEREAVVITRGSTAH